MSEDHHERLSFLDRPLPASFVLRVVTVAPATVRVFQDSDWHDALVVIESGRIELETFKGTRRGFAAGDVLCLKGLSVRALHNLGSEPAVLAAVSRRP